MRLISYIFDYILSNTLRFFKIFFSLFSFKDRRGRETLRSDNLMSAHDFSLKTEISNMIISKKVFQINSLLFNFILYVSKNSSSN